MKEKLWNIGKYDEIAVSELSKKLNISHVLAKLLINRGYNTADDALKFIKKDINTFHSPFLMKDVELGASVLIDAIKKGEKILVWGDYDVDGVTSVTVLIKYIQSINGKCEYYIPKRDDDGYGLNDRVINEYINNGTKLIITVDSGITAVKEIKHAKDNGVRVIVTDHHECREFLPEADAVINPKRPDCSYPFKELAGVGVVFKFICAVEMLLSDCNSVQASSKLLKHYAEFVAIGTIADVMPICDENRLIVSRGLYAIEKTENKGLAALAEESGITTSTPKKKKVSSATVGFILAPRINAAGRMETSKIAVDLFMTESREEAASLAVRLGEINKERQLQENASLVTALDKISTQCDLENDKILILEDDNWHHGIIGIVSSRITERYNLPSILISFKNEIADSDPDIGKGSARSIKGMNLVKSLESCSDILTKFGGHELAAGLSIKREKLPEFRRRINEYAKKAFENISLEKTLDIDCELDSIDIDIKLASELNKLEPFGLSNNVPVFASMGMRIHSVIAIGDGKHTKLLLEKNANLFTALLFGVPTSTLSFTEGDIVDVAFNIDINNFRNQQSVQMIVRDIKLCDSELKYINNQIEKYKAVISDSNTRVERSDIPTRTDFAHLYTTYRDLIQSIKDAGETYDLSIPYITRLAQRRFTSSLPLYKALIIFDVLEETNLIEVTQKSDIVYRTVRLNSQNLAKEKVILENAPTIRKLFSKM